MTEWASLVTVGRIVRPHGIRGQVVVASETDFGDERFRPGEAMSIDTPNGIRELRVTSSRPHDARWVVGFEGVTTMNDAEALRDAELRVAPDSLHALDPSRFYVHDLVGCEVTTTSGARVGRVDRVELNTGTALLVVLERGGEVLIPLVDTICRRVDVAAKRIEIDPPEGLIELNRGKSQTPGA
jgi:16S rRNA processing protein RimM